MRVTTDLDRIWDGATYVSWKATFQILSKSVRVKGGFYPKKHRYLLFGHFGAIFGHLKIIRFGWFFYWSTIVTYTFTISNFMTLLFQKVGGLPQKCPKMAVLCSFFGAVHILNRHRPLGVAPLTSPLSELPTHQMLWKSVRVKGLFWS